MAQLYKVVMKRNKVGMMRENAVQENVKKQCLTHNQRQDTCGNGLEHDISSWTTLRVDLLMKLASFVS